jgi:hypothetical protein
MDQGFSWLIGGFVTQFFNLIFNKFLLSFFPNPQNQVGFSRTRVECPISKKERKEGRKKLVLVWPYMLLPRGFIQSKRKKIYR